MPMIIRRPKMNLYHLSGRVIELWNQWELRAMMLLSLLLQIFLTVTGSRRKYTAGKYMAGFWLGMFVWLAYLSADWLATVSLGLLARSQGGSESNGTTSKASFIPAFWAPMLLVHLGGPDTITAYSEEDNELWSRHLLQLLTQLSIAFYASLRSWWSKDPLIYIIIPIFVSGIIKYGERIWVLWLASSKKFWDSANEERMHLQRQIDQRISTRELIVDMGTEHVDGILGFNNIISEEAKYLHEGHFLFRALKLLFADYLVTFPTHMISYHILKSKSPTEAFKLIEVELGLMYDVLFTKVMTEVNWQTRFILRFVNFLCSVSALLAFSLMARNFHAYSKFDIIISYLLLVGAIVLDVYSAILMLFCDWAVLWLAKQRKLFADSIYRVISSSRLLSLFSNNKRWKGSMAQIDLTDYRKSSNGHKLKFFSIGNIQRWEVVGDDLKKFFFNYLLDKRSRYRTGHVSVILEERGDQVHKRKGCFEQLGWSVTGKDYPESFLLWHLATHQYLDKDYSDSIRCKMSKSLSDYMMYLRSDLPFVLPKELGEPREEPMISDGEWLAISIQSLRTSEDKWEMISEVWVEMLTYAASRRGWKGHTKALTQGGELLTFVAFASKKSLLRTGQANAKFSNKFCTIKAHTMIIVSKTLAILHPIPET
ncbi:unnamed protein product [Dovyalis caffra]|uniref:DUF4220 domain-containing protein n=1 Tax=Dovyalis caffra TaxID=77055 RepID=A0AAV1S5A1_9ROSI|nr:unnamed protein product [Dovyalis caffra]